MRQVSKEGFLVSLLGLPDPNLVVCMPSSLSIQLHSQQIRSSFALTCPMMQAMQQQTIAWHPGTRNDATSTPYSMRLAHHVPVLPACEVHTAARTPE